MGDKVLSEQIFSPKDGKLKRSQKLASPSLDFSIALAVIAFILTSRVTRAIARG
jgi:hypothetical protein